MLALPLRLELDTKRFAGLVAVLLAIGDCDTSRDNLGASGVASSL